MTHLLPIKWIRAEAYCQFTGESINTVRERINDGVWAAGVHYRRTGPRTLWVSLPDVTAWIEKQPLVESQVPEELRSARASAATA